jgi:uncharacterized protein (DUF2249 family)
MDHGQTAGLLKTGKVHFDDLTEKTDGSNWKGGYDESGFYSQSSGSGNEKMRQPEDYEIRARRRAEETGKPLSLHASGVFGQVHDILQNNEPLQKHLKKQHEKTGEESAISGELFHRPTAKPSEVDGEVQPVGTSYDPKKWGKVGQIVIHSKLAANKDHDPEHFAKHLSDEHINFTGDKLEHTPSHIDVSNEKSDFDKLDHELIGSRTTKTNKEAKEAELAKMKDIQKKVSDKVDSHIKAKGLKPLYGSGSEGIVVHPVNDQPRFKVTSDAFRSYRASDAAKWKK